MNNPENLKKDKWNRIIREEIHLAGVRKVISQRMRMSLDSMPQGCAMARYDMSQIVKLKDKYCAQNTPVSYTDIMVKVVGAAVREVPVMNSIQENDLITVFDTVNVGIAIRVDNLLVVPAINDVNHKSLLQVAEDTLSTIENARNRRFDLIYMEGGTITVNNLGMYHIEGCHPILNPPETAELAIGRISQEAWVDENGAIAAKPVATLSLAMNHNVVDGGQVGEFMNVLAKIIRFPREYF